MKPGDLYKYVSDRAEYSYDFDLFPFREYYKNSKVAICASEFKENDLFLVLKTTTIQEHLPSSGNMPGGNIKGIVLLYKTQKIFILEGDSYLFEKVS